MSELEAERLGWNVDGLDWPNRAHSRFVEADGIRWHVQIAGEGPDLLLLHGAGGSTHSWAPLLPHLTRSFRVVAPDLPGHAFTTALPPEREDAFEMATAVGRFMDAVDCRPTGIVAHSAGAAVAVMLGVAGAARPKRWAFLAPSLSRPPNTVPPFIQNLLGPLLRADRTAALAALLGRSFITQALLESTGSRVPAASAQLYRRLAGNPAHVGAVFRLLTRWDPEVVERLLPDHLGPTLLLAGEADRWIPPADIRRVASDLPDAQLRVLPGLGHLLHEEAPDRVATEVLSWLADGTSPAS